MWQASWCVSSPPNSNTVSLAFIENNLEGECQQFLKRLSLIPDAAKAIHKGRERWETHTHSFLTFQATHSFSLKIQKNQSIKQLVGTKEVDCQSLRHQYFLENFFRGEHLILPHNKEWNQSWLPFMNHFLSIWQQTRRSSTMSQGVIYRIKSKTHFFSKDALHWDIIFDALVIESVM